VNGEESPKNSPFLLGFRHPAGGGPTTAIGNMHEKFGKDRACRSGLRRYARGQTDTHRDRHAHYNTSPGWLRGRTSVCDRGTFPVLRSTCSWRV